MEAYIIQAHQVCEGNGNGKCIDDCSTEVASDIGDGNVIMAMATGNGNGYMA